jgi:hypothetical protein
MQEMLTAQDWKELAIVADRAAQDTKNLTAKVGRASYTKAVDVQGIDPGAYAVSVIVQAVSDVLVKSTTH